MNDITPKNWDDMTSAEKWRFLCERERNTFSIVKNSAECLDFLRDFAMPADLRLWELSTQAYNAIIRLLEIVHVALVKDPRTPPKIVDMLFDLNLNALAFDESTALDDIIGMDWTGEDIARRPLEDIATELEDK